jgi:glutamate/tyrosine decarboxylase-like PLP-dependent enzyme
MLDDTLDHLAAVRERPVWQAVPDAVAKRFSAPLPQTGVGLEAAYAAFARDVRPYPSGNLHPRFWGWVIGNGTPSGMLADLLASGLNPNTGGFWQSPVLVERQALAWCAEMLGFAPETSGLLVSGASMANLLALTVARDVHFRRQGRDVRADGVTDGALHPVYTSAQTHSCNQRAVELLGLGSRQLRRVRVDHDYRLDVVALRAALREDVARGERPLALIGTAGTVNTGAIDPLDALADVAEEFGLWFHVDGAFGALAFLSPGLRERVQGLQRADSLAFDLHKWLSLPYGVGCVLVRDAGAHRQAFALTPDYLRHAERGVAAEAWWASEYGPELSRGFAALKVWMELMTHGVQTYAAVIERNVRQARLLAELVTRHPALELCAPVPLNIVCFRYAPDGLGTAQTDLLNEELLMRLQESGEAVLSSTRLQDRYVLRCAVVNHRSRDEDFEHLVQTVVSVGHTLRAQARAGSPRKSKESV